MIFSAVAEQLHFSTAAFYTIFHRERGLYPFYWSLRVATSIVTQIVVILVSFSLLLPTTAFSADKHDALLVPVRTTLLQLFRSYAKISDVPVRILPEQHAKLAVYTSTPIRSWKASRFEAVFAAIGCSIRLHKDSETLVSCDTLTGVTAVYVHELKNRELEKAAAKYRLLPTALNGCSVVVGTEKHVRSFLDNEPIQDFLAEETEDEPILMQALASDKVLALFELAGVDVSDDATESFVVQVSKCSTALRLLQVLNDLKLQQVSDLFIYLPLHVRGPMMSSRVLEEFDGLVVGVVDNALLINAPAKLHSELRRVLPRLDAREAQLSSMPIMKDAKKLNFPEALTFFLESDQGQDKDALQRMCSRILRRFPENVPTLFWNSLLTKDAEGLRQMNITLKLLQLNLRLPEMSLSRNHYRHFFYRKLYDTYVAGGDWRSVAAQLQFFEITSADLL